MSSDRCECPMCRRMRLEHIEWRPPIYIDVMLPDTPAYEAALYSTIEAHQRGPMPKKNVDPLKPLDEVEMELVRADIAEAKARLEENGDMTKWRKDQALNERRRRGDF